MKKVLEFINKNKIWILCILFILIFIFIAEDLLESSISNLDDSVYKILIEPIRNDTNTKIFKVITNMASSIVLIGICLLSFIIFKNKKYGIFTVINLANVMILNIVLKNIFSRPRPEELMLINETGYSFPSGHSMAAMAFYGFFIYLIWQTKWKKGIKVFSSLCLGALIILIGISRLYLGVHYTSDVIAGFSISLAYLIIFTLLVSKYMLKRSEKMNNKNKSLKKSFYYAIQGITECIKIERNMKIHFIIMNIVILFGFLFSISVTEWIICITLFGLVISLELVNTAIENAVDISTSTFNEKAKIAKDTSAGAVLLVAIISAVIGLIIFIPKIITLLR